jgi:hypothetical protein
VNVVPGLTCRHCGRVLLAAYARRLCKPCHRSPAVRDRYPAAGPFARRGVGLGHRVHAPPPDCPTDARPGSEAKILVLIDRAARGQQLFHPADAAE